MTLFTLSQTLCHELADKVMQHAQQDGLAPVCIAIVDPQGELNYFGRMDAAPARTIAIAQAKAYTAARMQNSTLAFSQRLHNEQLYTFDFMDTKLCALPGGVPLSIQQHLIGAVGISGRSLEDDHALALFVSEYVATQFR